MIMGMQTVWVMGDRKDILKLPKPQVEGYLTYGGRECFFTPSFLDCGFIQLPHQVHMVMSRITLKWFIGAKNIIYQYQLKYSHSSYQIN